MICTSTSSNSGDGGDDSGHTTERNQHQQTSALTTATTSNGSGGSGSGGDHCFSSSASFGQIKLLDQLTLGNRHQLTAPTTTTTTTTTTTIRSTTQASDTAGFEHSPARTRHGASRSSHGTLLLSTGGGGSGDVRGGGDDTVQKKKALGYKNCLLEKLNEQRLSTPPLACDMVIECDEQRFSVHKCLMIASCDYFAAMFNSGMQETRAAQIQLRGVSSQGLAAVVDFVYSGELRLCLGSVSDVLRAVSHLQVRNALQLCEDYLIEATSVDNCVDMLNLAEMFSIQAVCVEVHRYMLRNFDQLVAGGHYLKLTLEQMRHFLRSNQLRLYPEMRVFNAVVNWLRNYMSSQQQQQQQQASSKHSHNNSSKNPLSSPQLSPQDEATMSCVDGSSSSSSSGGSGSFSPVYELMQHVRFGTMKPAEFVNAVAKHELVRGDPRCNELLIEGYEHFALAHKQYGSVSPRATIRNEPVMVCVNESMYILNRREESWQYLCQSLATSKTLSQKFVVVNNFLYACGGYSETNRETCNKCHRFDPRTGQWYPIAAMNEKRQFFTLVANNECIVAVGGVYGNVGNFYATIPVESPVEVYSIEHDSWQSLAQCDIPILKWPGACVDNKRVFVVGGKLTEGPHHSLSQQSFIVDLASSQVELCPPPITTRFNPSVFHDATDNRFILFGGEDDKYRLAPCIEVFDMVTRQWTEVATIPVSLSYQCISSTSMTNAKIYYLLEEHDGPASESYILKSAYFDTKTCQFETPTQLPHPSTLASKWCSLVFPQEFLEEKCQALSSSNDCVSSGGASGHRDRSWLASFNQFNQQQQSQNQLSVINQRRAQQRQHHQPQHHQLSQQHTSPLLGRVSTSVNPTQSVDSPIEFRLIRNNLQAFGSRSNNNNNDDDSRDNTDTGFSNSRSGSRHHVANMSHSCQGSSSDLVTIDASRRCAFNTNASATDVSLDSMRRVDVAVAPLLAISLSPPAPQSAAALYSQDSYRLWNSGNSGGSVACSSNANRRAVAGSNYSDVAAAEAGSGLASAAEAKQHQYFLSVANARRSNARQNSMLSSSASDTVMQQHMHMQSLSAPRADADNDSEEDDSVSDFHHDSTEANSINDID